MAYQLLRRVAGEDPNLRLKFSIHYLRYQAQHTREERKAFEVLARTGLCFRKLGALFYLNVGKQL